MRKLKKTLEDIRVMVRTTARYAVAIPKIGLSSLLGSVWNKSMWIARDIPLSRCASRVQHDQNSLTHHLFTKCIERCIITFTLISYNSVPYQE